MAAIAATAFLHAAAVSTGAVAATPPLAPPSAPPSSNPPPTAEVEMPAPSGRAWDFAALPLVYYQPETSLGAVGQLELVRKASSGATAQDRHDTVSVAFTATLRRQYALTLSGLKFWNQDRDRLKVDLLAERFPNTFWGLGKQTPAEAADPYTPLMAGGQLNYSHRVIEKVFVGVNALGGYYRLQTFTPGGPVDAYLATRRRAGTVLGVGPALVRDSRDDSNYPRRGSLSTMTMTAYLPAWFSDYRYLAVDLDQRTFLTLPWSSVLALQAYGNMIAGEAPLDLLPALGGPALLRGYFQGRYRDKVYAVAQAEWRVPLFWRLGAAVFGAVGNVFPDIAHISGHDPKAAGGLGLRVNVAGASPLNLRLDAAITRDAELGVYLIIGEAF